MQQVAVREKLLAEKEERFEKERLNHEQLLATLDKLQQVGYMKPLSVVYVCVSLVHRESVKGQ